MCPTFFLLFFGLIFLVFLWGSGAFSLSSSAPYSKSRVWRMVLLFARKTSRIRVSGNILKPDAHYREGQIRTTQSQYAGRNFLSLPVDGHTLSFSQLSGSISRIGTIPVTPSSGKKNNAFEGILFFRYGRDILTRQNTNGKWRAMKPRPIYSQSADRNPFPLIGRVWN